MTNQRKIVEQFMNNESPERAPVVFWHHFVSFHDHHRGLTDPAVMKKVLDGQLDYIRRFKPDLVKIMSDGFFGHPAMTGELIDSVAGIRGIQPCGAAHPFIQEQVEYVKKVCDFVNGDVYTYYNLFSPLQYIRLKFEEYDEDFEKFTRLFFEDMDAMVAAGDRIASDILLLIDRIFEKTRVDGIYYSVQSVQDPRADRAFHDAYVRPLDLMIMDRIRKYTDNIMIHICGYGHYQNPLAWYADYPAKIFNWATHTEQIGLAEGKKIFKDKPVLGGFDNNAGSLLYEGSKAELKDEIYRILDAAGTKGVALGADCTVKETFDPERARWIIDIAGAYGKDRGSVGA